MIEFTREMDFEHFRQDKLCYFATIKNIEIIGEAAYMISQDFKASHPEIPWEGIIRMRHVLVHGYATILPELLWETIQADIPQLIGLIQKLA